MGCAESRNTVQPQGAFSVVTSSSSPAGFFHRSAATSNNTGSSAPTAAAAKAAKKKCRLRKTSTLFPEPQASTTAASITTTSQNADAQTRCTSPSVAEIAHAKGNAASSSSSTSTVTPLPTFVNGPSLQLLPTEKQNLQHLTFEELSLQFLKAVKNGDVAFVERLEQQAAKLSPSPPAGGLINIRGMWESTPLIYACQYGHAKAAMWLLQQGANVHCQNEKGMTALLLASLEGMTDVVEWILAKYATSPIEVDTPATGDKLSEHLSIDKQIGVVYNSVADLNIRVNPLLAASMNGHVDIVTKLLTARDASNNSVSVNFGVAASASVASTKQFALLLAAKYGHASVVRVLTKHGADFATSDLNGNHALLLACEAAKDECAMELLRLLPGTREVEGSGAADSHVPPPSHAYIATWKHANAHGLTALHFAAANGLLHVVQRMVVTLQWGLDRDFLNAVSVNRRERALLMACRKRQSEVVQLLISVGADFELADRGGTTALQVLKRDKKDDLVKLCEHTRRLQSKAKIHGAGVTLEKRGSNDIESISGQDSGENGTNVLPIDVGESEAMQEEKASIPDCSLPQIHEPTECGPESKSSPTNALIEDQNHEVATVKGEKPDEVRIVNDAREIRYDAPKIDWKEMRMESRELDSMNSMLARSDNGRNASSRKNSLEPQRGTLSSANELVEDETKGEANSIEETPHECSNEVVQGEQTQIDSGDEKKGVRQSLMQQAIASVFTGEEEVKTGMAIDDADGTNHSTTAITDAALIYTATITAHGEASSDDRGKKVSPVKPKHRRKERSPRKAKEKPKLQDTASTAAVHDDDTGEFPVIETPTSDLPSQRCPDDFLVHEPSDAIAPQESIVGDFGEPTIQAVDLNQHSSRSVLRNLRNHGPVDLPVKVAVDNGVNLMLASDRLSAEDSKDDDSILLSSSPSKEKRKKKKHHHSTSSTKRKQATPN